jgi:hypothetical protein
MPQVTPMSGINFPMWEVELGPQFYYLLYEYKSTNADAHVPSDVPITQLRWSIAMSLWQFTTCFTITKVRMLTRTCLQTYPSRSCEYRYVIMAIYYLLYEHNSTNADAHVPSDVPITQLPIEYRYVIMDSQTSKVLAGSPACCD